jgi:nucleotide-binding universal stress UspA family protein
MYGGLMAPAVVQSSLAVTWTVIENERVAETLVRIAERREDAGGLGAFGGCDVIAMATHGLTGFQRFTLGSVAARVMALTRRPVLLMRPVGSAKTVLQAEETFLPEPVLGQSHAQSQAW